MANAEVQPSTLALDIVGCLRTYTLPLPLANIVKGKESAVPSTDIAEELQRIVVLVAKVPLDSVMV